CRNARSEQGRRKKNRADAEINSRIETTGLKKHRLQRARDRDGADESNRRSNQKQMHAVRKDERANLRRSRAEREADADFGHALERGVGEKPVKSDRREQERKSREDREEKTQEPMRSPGFLDAIKHRTRIVDRLIRI